MTRLRQPHDFMWSYTKGFLKCFTRPVLIYLVVFSITLILTASTIFYFLEQGQNPNVNEFLDALYFTVGTMTTVGFGDIVATTRAGRIFTVALMLSGTLLYVSFTAVLASSIIEFDQTRNQK